MVFDLQKDFIPAIREAYYKTENMVGNLIECFSNEMNDCGDADQSFVRIHQQLHYLGVPPIRHSLILEPLIRHVLGLGSAFDKDSGDGASNSGCAIEMKTSLIFEDQRLRGTPHYNVRHIRPWQNLSHYLLHFYDDREAECHWFLISAKRFHLFIEESGIRGSTVGTMLENTNNRNVEREVYFYPRPNNAKQNASGITCLSSR